MKKPRGRPSDIKRTPDKDYQRHWRRKYPEKAKRLRDEFTTKLATFKLEHGCADYGFRGHHTALEFDHRPGTEKCFEISQSVRSWERVLQEIKKCEVVCACCHAIRTWNRYRPLMGTKRTL